MLITLASVQLVQKHHRENTSPKYNQCRLIEALKALQDGVLLDHFGINGYYHKYLWFMVLKCFHFV